jgi:uncharacterized protein YjbI with pentapeptide repeats
MADLFRADLSEAILDETTFVNMDLRAAKGLAECNFKHSNGFSSNYTFRRGTLKIVATVSTG